MSNEEELEREETIGEYKLKTTGEVYRSHFMHCATFENHSALGKRSWKTVKRSNSRLVHEER